MKQGDGYVIFDYDARLAHWADVARRRALELSANTQVRARNLRHGETWFVGVDLLDNDETGAVQGVALRGAWQDHLPALPLHRAQVSIVYPGYPKRDAGESAANHRFRRNRFAAHVDGLLPVGETRRRFAHEHHAYILGIPLDDCTHARTVMWEGSHRIMQRALQDAIGTGDIVNTDVTEAYSAARKEVFERCEPVEMGARVGQAFWLHRFALHGTLPWQSDESGARMVAFFRPEFDDPAQWLAT